MNVTDIISRGVNLIARSIESTASISGLSNPDNWLKEAFSINGFYGGQDSGVAVNSKTIQQIPAYISGLRLLSETMACLSGKFIEETESTTKILSNDPRSRLVFRKPNKFQTANIFWETAVKYTVHKGNFFAIILRDENQNPLELIPIHESIKVEVIYSQDRLWYRIKGIDGIFSSDDIFHLKGLGDGRIGIGAIEYAATTAGITLATQKNQATFFKSGSKLQGYITHPKKLGKDTLTKLRESWHAVYHSDGGNNQTAMLDEGMEYKTVTVTPEAAKYLETLKNGYYDIAAILRVPPHMIALMDKSSFNNITHQNIEFVQNGFLIWVKRIESECYDKLLTEEEKKKDEKKFKWNIDALLRGDYKTRMEGYRIAINAGIMSQNDVRKLEDLEPFDGGDRRWIQMNMMPLDSAEEILNRAADQLALHALNKNNDEQAD